MLNNWTLRIGGILIGLAGSCHWAFAQHADLEIDIAVGALAVEPEVAEGEFGEGLNPAYRADDPGFDAEGTLPVDDMVGFRIPSFSIDGANRNLWYWDGSGDVSFGPVPAGHHLNVIHFPTAQDIATNGGGLLDGTDGDLFGFVFAIADGAGEIHDHLTFDLTDDTGIAGSIAVPEAGVYMWAMRLTGETLADSNRFFWVMANGVEEESHELAALYVERNLVPEPSSWMTAVLGGLAFLTMRRRTTPRQRR